MKHLSRALHAAIALITAIIIHAADTRELTTILALNNNNGLSNSAVNTVYQDSDGLMWFGTWDGLNRYDGTSVSQYRHHNGDPSSLSHQVIRSISEEDARYLWITTDYGINRLDKLTGTFRQYFLDYKPEYIYRERSFTCHADRNGHIAASFFAEGLYLFNRDTESFTRVNIGNCKHQPKIVSLTFDEKDVLWALTTDNTVIRIEISGDNRATATHEIVLPHNHGAVTLLYDNNKYIWFSADGTLYNINIYDTNPCINDTRIPVDGNLLAACADNGQLLIGTSTGCYEVRSGKLIRYSGINASVLSIYKGSQGIIWIGTDGKGVYQQYRRPTFITCVEPAQYASDNNYPVRAILKDHNEKLWIGSKGGGLSQISHLGAIGLEQTVTFNVGTGRTSNSVLSMAQGKDRIWIGTDGSGLQYYDTNDGCLKHLDLSAAQPGKAIESVYCILQPDSATLYLGTSGNGLFKLTLNPRQNKVTDIINYLHTDARSIGSNIIYALADDGEFLWIATRGGGLSRMNKSTAEIDTYKTTPGNDSSICSNDIIALLKDSRGRLWVGTTSGISLLEDTKQKNPVFRTFDKNAGLPNTNIHSIKEDCNHEIWVSTSQGITKISADDMQTTSYFYEDGLQDNEFSDGAGFAAADGSALYFGGINGFNIIYPSRITNIDFMPKLIVNSVSTGDEPYIMTDNTIRASYKTSSIDIAFAVTDYIDNKKCHMYYRLEPQSLFNFKESKWISLGNGRNVTLSQLPSGTYKLSVKISNADQSWSEPRDFTIEISDPIWATWWALCIYLLLIIAIIRQTYKVKRTRLMIKHELELEKQEKRNKEEIHQAKLRFFTNIAHEFSNSITLIYGAVEQVLAKGTSDKNIKKQLLAIQSNAERMHHQIQELMEFRKAETGYLHVQLEKVDINELIKCTFDNFIDIAESKKINLGLTAESGQPVWITDRSMLEKVIFNLLSNALKYTPEGGYVTIATELAADNNLKIACTNNGPGIPPGELQNVFNRFTILDNFERKLSQGMYSRNGIGLALCKDLVTLMGGTITVSSEVDRFTSFTIMLPHHDESEISAVRPADGGLSIPLPYKPQNNLFDTKKPTILIIDDQKDICEMIKDILGDNYESLTASTGNEALHILEEKTPSLIICDIIMPEMDGIQFIGKIKANERTKYIPVIMLSSKSDIESRIEVLETGANMFINKPFHPHYLKVAVDNILQNHILMRQFSESASAYKELYNNTLVHKDDKSFIDKVIDILSKNYGDEDYDQDALARDMALTRIQLYRKLKKIANTTPGEFIRSYRMTQAEKMLRHTDKTIQEIMSDCGFHNKAYFYRLFQKVHNCSPKDYRNSNEPE